MARVPTVQGGFVDRARTNLPAVQAPDMTAGGRAIGQAAERLGAAVTSFAEQEDALDRARDEAAAKLLDTEYSEWSREKLFTGEGAFYTQEGFAADAARKPLEEEIEAKRAEIVGRTSNARQAKMVEDALRRRISSDLEGVARHSVSQYRIEERRQSEARLGAARDDALLYADDRTRFGEELLVGEAEIRSAGARAGEAPETTDFEIEEWRSSVYRDVGAGLIRSGRIDDAIAWQEGARGNMTPDDENDLEAALYRPLLERKVDGLADFVMAGGEPLAPGAEAADDGSNGRADNPVVVAERRKGFAIASPVAGGRVTSRYGRRTAPIAGASTDHRALDIASPAGTPIVAQADGRVISAGPEGAAGNVVRIDYGNGVVFSYAHMDGFAVKPGDVVKAGSKLGGVGTTGRTTGPHVHTVARVNGERVDPENFTGEIGGSIAAAGAGNAPEARAQKHDLGKLLARVDAMGLPFEEEKALKAEIERRVSTDEALQRRTEAEAAERALEVLDRADAAGTPITKESAISADVWKDMSATDRLRFRDVIRENAKPAPRKTDYREYTRLSDLYASDPEAFGRINPVEYRNALDDTDYERVLGWRRDVLDGGASASEKQVSHSKIRTISGQVRRMQGLTTDGIKAKDREERQAMERRIYKLEQAVSRDVELWQRANPGKPVPDDVIQRSAERQLAETRPEGAERPDNEDRRYWFERNSENGRYTIRIPKKDRERLARIGRQELGREPTAEEISAAWIAEGRGGY